MMSGQKMGLIACVKTMRQADADGELLAVVPVGGEPFQLDTRECVAKWDEYGRTRYTSERTNRTCWGVDPATGESREILWEDVDRVAPVRIEWGPVTSRLEDGVTVYRRVGGVA